MPHSGSGIYPPAPAGALEAAHRGPAIPAAGIYLAVPFCRSKCSFCNFRSGVYPAAAQPQYVARMCSEMRTLERRLSGAGLPFPRAVDSVYLGGGTPSLLAPALLLELRAALRQEFDLSAGCEITMECAPGQVDDATVDAMLEFGVNRVSFGVQSFVDREAAAVGRLHNREIALEDMQRMRRAGIDNLSVDLIAGLPYQDEASWTRSLDALSASSAVHASVYMLEIDEGSRLGRELLRGGDRYRARSAPDEDRTADLYEMAIDRLEREGLRQYEISNFARPGLVSRHNARYWRRESYLGFGLDAHSMLRPAPAPGRRSIFPSPPHGESVGPIRWANTDRLEDYLTAAESAPEVHRLSAREELEESWFLGLRMADGVRWEGLAEEFGEEALTGSREAVEELKILDLLEEQEGAVRLTRRGLLFSNDVFARFLRAGEGSTC